jgi:acetyltransferase
MTFTFLHPHRQVAARTADFLSAPAHFGPEYTYFSKQYGRIKMRPIRPDDEQRMIRFHEGLSEENIYLRYFEYISLDTRTLHERLAKVCTIGANSYAIVAETPATGRSPAEIIAIGRLTMKEIPRVASFAMLIRNTTDKDIPRELLRRLITVARAYGFRLLHGELLKSDRATLALCESFGFTTQALGEDGIVYVSYPL